MSEEPSDEKWWMHTGELFWERLGYGIMAFLLCLGVGCCTFLGNLK